MRSVFLIGFVLCAWSLWCHRNIQSRLHNNCPFKHVDIYFTLSVRCIQSALLLCFCSRPLCRSRRRIGTSCFHITRSKSTCSSPVKHMSGSKVCNNIYSMDTIKCSLDVKFNILLFLPWVTWMLFDLLYQKGHEQNNQQSTNEAYISLTTE